MKLSSKSILTILLVLLVTFSLAGWSHLQNERNVLTGIMKKHGISLAHSIATSCIETLLSEDYPVLDTYLETMGKEGSEILFIEVIHQEKLVSRYLAKHVDTSDSVVFKSDILFSIEQNKSLEKIGEVRLGMSDRENKLIIAARIRELIIMISSIFVFIMLVEILLINKIVIRPIRKLVEGIRRVTKGELTNFVEIKSRDEIGNLATSFNDMTSQLEESKRRLHDYAFSLEEMVKDKTKEIIDRKHAEEQIKVSLKEKEVLLMEIHHRVRNNLQIISSLFSLHTMKIKDEQNIKIFKDAQNRIQSMAAIHGILYEADHLSDVNFYQYVELLTDRLFSSFGIDPDEISIKINIKDVSLKIEQAIPVGLLVNELLSNSLEHAFPFDKIRIGSFDSDQVKPEGKQEEHEIRIALTPALDNKNQLIVCDNGIGIPEDLDFKNTDSLGLSLVNIIAEDQLKGEVTLDRNAKGTKFQIIF